MHIPAVVILPMRFSRHSAPTPETRYRVRYPCNSLQLHRVNDTASFEMNGSGGGTARGIGCLFGNKHIIRQLVLCLWVFRYLLVWCWGWACGLYRYDKVS